MPPPKTIAERRSVDLSRLSVTEEIAARLDQLVETTGAPGTWHRRRALEQYLDRELGDEDS